MAQDTTNTNVTALLIKWREGDSAALDALIPLVYAELRRVAITEYQAALALEPDFVPCLINFAWS